MRPVHVEEGTSGTGPRPLQQRCGSDVWGSFEGGCLRESIQGVQGSFQVSIFLKKSGGRRSPRTDTHTVNSWSGEWKGGAADTQTEHETFGGWLWVAWHRRDQVEPINRFGAPQRSVGHFDFQRTQFW